MYRGFLPPERCESHELNSAFFGEGILELLEHLAGGGVQCGLTLLGTDRFPLKIDGWKMMKLMSFKKWSRNFRKHSFVLKRGVIFGGV